MPSRNSFSIRKLFTSPRRLSFIADETQTTADGQLSDKRRSDVSSGLGQSQNQSRSRAGSRGTIPTSRGSTISGNQNHARNASNSTTGSSSTVFNPDSSFSITTPQAERGLTDNVDHELSQEEIDRIKAVVAAAAAAAATSLRLRIDDGTQAIETIKTIQAAIQADESGGVATIDNDTSDVPPPIPRKKRPIPQPIVVPPRNAARLTAGARPAVAVAWRGDAKGSETKKDKEYAKEDVKEGDVERDGQNKPNGAETDADKANAGRSDGERERERADRIDRTDRLQSAERKERRNHCRLASQGSSSQRSLSQRSLSQRSQRSQRSQMSQGRRPSLGAANTAKSGKSQQHQQQHSQNNQQRRQREATTKQRKGGGGKSRGDPNARKGNGKGQTHEEGEAGTPALQTLQTQSQLVTGNSQGHQTKDKRHSRPPKDRTLLSTQSQCQSQTASAPSKTSNNGKEAGKQKNVSTEQGRAAWQHDHEKEYDNEHGDDSVPLWSSSSPSSSQTSSKPLTASQSLSSSSTKQSSSSPSSSSQQPRRPSLPVYTTIPLASIVSPRASLPNRHPSNLLSKALPPPPPPRVSSYFATKSSWKSKTKSNASKTEKTEKISKPRPKVITSQSTASNHPLYRQAGEPDSKKDSGIALDKSQTSLVETKNDKTENTNNNTNTNTTPNIVDDSDSDSDASCIDLLQALAIQPEEADLLRRQTIELTSTSTSTTSPKMQSSLEVSETDTSAVNTADGPVLHNVCTTPTFTQPRMAPTPSPSAVPSETNTPRQVMSPSPSPRPSGTFSALTPSSSPSASPSPPKKQSNRFLPLRLNKGLPDAALRIQRKRSKKAARKRAAVTSNPKGQFSEGKSQMDVGKAGDGSNNNTTASSSGSRWTLPDNVTELFNGRLFSRMEVTETLPFEKLQAIRESRALAQKQQEEAEEKKKAKQLADEQDEKEKREKRELQNQKQQQELADAERALLKELHRPPSKPDTVETSTAPLETLVECEEEELQVSPLEPDDLAVDADGNPIEPPVSMPVSPPAEPFPPPTLPMPPHIASQIKWPGIDGHNDEVSPEEEKPPSVNVNTTKTKTLFLSPAREEPDGSTTPIEPFHMEDLPSRIGAAGVRVSILLPVEEEEAYFASSVAQHKERRRREREEREREEANMLEGEEVEEEDDEDSELMPDPPKSPLDGIGPFPSPPTKNPMRFQSFIKKTAPPPPLTEPPPAQPIPQVTITDVDVDSQSKRRRRSSTPKTSKASKSASRKSIGKAPKSSFYLSSSSLHPNPPHSHHPPASFHMHSSSLSVSSSTSSMAAVAAAATSTIPQPRDDATYVYLSATPFSLVMPTYRHGPIRLKRADLLEQQASSRNSYDQSYTRDHHHPHIASVDDTLDWTAFQMAILGGAGGLFEDDSIDYGQIAAAEVDEADRLADWFWSLDLKQERLLTSAEEDAEWVRPVPPPPDAMPLPIRAATSPPVLSHHTQRTPGSQWTSVSSNIVPAPNHILVGAVPTPSVSGSRGLTHSRTATNTSIGTMASGYSSGSSRESGHVNAVSAVSASSHSLTPQTANLALPFPMSRGNSSVSNLGPPANEPRTVQTIVHVHPPVQVPPRSQTHPNVNIRASYASYESMPQSPMADLIMTRGADGKEYVAPMGYNLSHDLGDYLQWEKDNVYAVALETPR